jgi:hypothetical protein
MFCELEVICQLHGPAGLIPWKSSLYSLDRTLGGLYNRSGKYGELRSLEDSGIRTLILQFVHPVASRYID